MGNQSGPPSSHHYPFHNSHPPLLQAIKIYNFIIYSLIFCLCGSVVSMLGDFFFHVKAIRTLVLYIIKILILKKMAFLIILKAKNTCHPFPKIKNFKKIIEIELLQLIVVF